ncbi:Phage tail assembly chaperone protein [Pseudomonas sp. NFACC15-1]|uniref:phage tail assembly chaperone n=1 Tax=unclassified Pseudomonas TaxID=196821 RepID=UPI00088BABC0|nr:MULTISPECIES: phage tail assembly chaperone [unclassified Pseudomonas]SDA94714.1 Phage tail assembly chaperone protein [Pseudomonas sp. NFACC15-1]SDX01715.1 Phage tail assembly chaperone protein [Pseudomonas sp. NFACC14]
MSWARIENGAVVETTDLDPAERFHPDLFWQVCPANTRPGWTFIEGAFSPPSIDDSLALADAERVWRNFELGATEWLVARHRDEQDLGAISTLTLEQFSELLAYRQALRDWPQTPDFPLPKARPTAPSWLSEQIQ